MTSVVEGERTTRQRILDAALTAFAERGFGATSLDSLAAEIGIRKQTILYWFASKDALLLAVVDHAVAQLGAELTVAARAAGARRVVPDRAEQLRAVVDATLRIGTQRPELLAVVREITRVGAPASTQLAAALAPLVSTAVEAFGAQGPEDAERMRRVLLGAGARVVGLITEAEVLADLGLATDVAWLRRRRRELLASLAPARC